MAPDKFPLNFYGKHPIISHLIMMAVAGLILLGIGFLFLDIWTDHGDTTEIPDVTGISCDRALAVLNAGGFKPEISDSVYDTRFSPGTVISVWPRSGAVVKPGREVFLTIASFQPRKVVVSMSLKNVSSRQAMKYLESLDIKNVRIVHMPSQFADLVLGAKYKGREIEPGALLPVNAEVTLEVGTVPTVVEEDINAEGIERIDAQAEHSSSGNQEGDGFSTSAVYD